MLLLCIFSMDSGHAGIASKIIVTPEDGPFLDHEWILQSELAIRSRSISLELQARRFHAPFSNSC